MCSGVSWYYKYHNKLTSLCITSIINSRDRLGKVWLLDFCTSDNHVYTENTHLYCSSNSVTLLNAAKLIYSKFSKFKIYPHFICCQPASLPACLPTVIPNYGRCMAQEFLHSKGNKVRFTKLLFWRMYRMSTNFGKANIWWLAEKLQLAEF